ncbi:MAG: alpha-hydroxy acid oxidase, partial [Planktomarina sp.]
MDLHVSYPALSDLKAKAKKRIPHFAWEYLDSATGNEATLLRNRTALDEIKFLPRGLRGEIAPDITTTFLGRDYAAPFGIAPVGMSGLMWPGAEKSLSGFAKSANIPYSLSTVAAATPEDVAPNIDGNGWFQMYPPRDAEIRNDMMSRVRDAGFDTLVVTIDVPAPARRERQLRGGLVQPPKLTPRILAQVMQCPEWAIRTALHGNPRMKMIDGYAAKVMAGAGTLPSNNHVGYLLRTAPDHDYVKILRDAWDGPLIVKGVMCPDDAAPLAGLGVDAVWVSNHAGRQFAGGPATIEALPLIKQATTLPIIFDSGVEGGLDI